MDKKKIMIVEDEELIAFGLQIKLEKIGYKVCLIVNTGEEAIANFQSLKPDIILMDIMLSGAIDGIETAKKIQAISKIPIIFSTGYLDEETKNRAKDVKYAEYFIKPVDTPDLIKAIDNVLKKLGS